MSVSPCFGEEKICVNNIVDEVENDQAHPILGGIRRPSGDDADDADDGEYKCKYSKYLNVYLLAIPLVAFLFAAVINDVAKSFNDNEINVTYAGSRMSVESPIDKHELARCNCDVQKGNYSTTVPSVPPSVPTAQPTTLPPALEVDKFELGKVEIESLIHELSTYYTGLDILKDTFAMPWNNSEFSAGMEVLSDKFARAIVWGENFIVGTIGSSVTAAHDNCAYDSYQNQLQRTMRPIMNALDIKIEVRNAGQGGACGDSYRNQILCLRNLVGDDVDTTHYSWTYFEGTDAEEYHEMFARWSLLMEKSPCPVILNTGKGDESSFEGSTMLARYFNFGYNEIYMERGLAAHVKDYPGKVWARVGDGLHNTTRYGEKVDSVERKNSLGVEFRNWHPGPLLFQTVSDAFALQYSVAIHAAIVKIENVLKRGDTPKTIWPHKPVLLTVADLPIELGNTFFNLNEIPSCSNFELPTFGPAQINIMDVNDAFNDEKSYYDSSFSNFKIWKSTPSTLIPRAERHLPECQHADYCRGYRKEVDIATNPITFRLPRMEQGFVAFCGIGKKNGQEMIDQNVTTWFDTVDVSAHIKSIWGKCVQVQYSFATQLRDLEGHLTLAIKFPKGSDTFTITHVITA